jgi:hypothetical protein
VTSVDHLVFAGNASGPPPAISARELARRGSLLSQGPLLFNYVVTREELTSAAHEVFAAVKSKKVCAVIRQKYLLAEARRGATSRAGAPPARLCSCPQACRDGPAAPSVQGLLQRDRHRVPERGAERATAVDALERAIDGKLPAV